MESDPLNIQLELSETAEMDFPDEGMNEQIYPNVMLVDNTAKPVEKSSPGSVPAGDQHTGHKEEIQGEGTMLSSGGPYSSLDIYTQTLNQFRPLHEEDEFILAKQIKEREEECKNLAIKWARLFRKECLKKSSVKKVKEMSQNLKSLNNTFELFDGLIQLERGQKKIAGELKRLTKESKTREKIQEELYTVRAEIGKAIAEITLGKTTSTIMGELKKLSHSNKETKKQQIITRELKRLLREIDHRSKEIRALKARMIQAHLRLVFFLAKKYTHRGLSLPDLIQEGNLGLIRAIDTFDYQRGPRFISYATWWIKQAFIRALNSKSMTIRKPVYVSEKLCQINKTSNRLLKECEREPTLEEIACKTNTPLEAVERVVQSFKDPLSLDTSYEGNGEGIITFIQDKKSIPTLERAISSNLSEILDGVLCDLTPREQEIVKLRFGIDTTHDHTLEEIGEKFNLSRERIRQILEVALKTLRNLKHMRRLQDFIELN
jgi:RNA polymerase primary sigma factor